VKRGRLSGSPEPRQDCASGFVAIPNDVFETLMLRWPLSRAAHRVISWIVRNSWGWQKRWTRTRLEPREIAKATGLHRATVWEAIRDLKNNQFIDIGPDGKARVNKEAMSGRYTPAGKWASDQPPSGESVAVAKRRQECRQMTTEVSPNDDSSAVDSQEVQRVADPYIHIHTSTDINISAAPASKDQDGKPQPSKEPAPDPGTGCLSTAGSPGRGSLARRMWDADCRDVLRHWDRRFPRVSLTIAQAGLVIKASREFSVSPIWLIDCVQIDHANPLSKLMGYIKRKYPLPEMPDQQRRFCTFHVWDMRPRQGIQPGEIKSIGDILSGLGAKDQSRKEAECELESTQ
jgi:hypothetical protein